MAESPPGYWVNQGGNMVFVTKPSGGVTGGGATATAQNPPGRDTGGANLLHAMNAVAQAEERRPGSAGSKILAYLDRRITDLENRVGRVEATE